MTGESGVIRRPPAFGDSHDDEPRHAGLHRQVPALLPDLFGMAMNHCLESGGKHVEPKHFRLMMACSEICRTSVHFMLMNSAHHMDGCVEACRLCAESCRAMAA